MDIAEELVRELIKRKESITCAESCTGGMMASMIVDVPDASKVLEASFVTYSEQAKEELLGVNRELIKEKGVVSIEVARAMAEGAAKKAGADYALSSTGIAGPGGGTKKDPVGTVCLGFSVHGRSNAVRIIFNGDRSEVRRAASAEAFKILLGMIKEEACE